jgi:tetratricopeptide (TPR) repeat protein
VSELPASAPAGGPDGGRGRGRLTSPAPRLVGSRSAPSGECRSPRPLPPPGPPAARLLLLALLASSQLAWLDPHQKAREGNRHYAAGKYDEAATRYNEALVDEPDSALLHFNLGDAAYKQGKYDEALTAFQQVPAGDENKPRAARVAYNIGNVKFRLGEAAESSEPQKALGLWAEALASYRRALGAAPDDLDAKVNHELVERKIAELKKKLEEQQKEQEEKQQQQQQQDQQKEEQQQGDQQQQPEQDEQKQEEPKEEAEKQEEPKPEEQQQAGGQDQQKEEDQKRQQQAGAAGEEGEKNDELSPQEAAALLDSQREQEVRPDEVVKKLQGAGIAGPAQDW